MTNTTTATRIPHFASIEVAWQDVNSSFERFCLTAGIGAIEHMLCADAQHLTGVPHSRGGDRAGPRWGRPRGKISFQMVARLRCIGRVCAASTAMNLRCQPGRRRRRGLAWPLGHEPDADQHVDAQAAARGAAARWRCSGHCRGRHLEVGGLAPVRGIVGPKAGRVDGV
jgi:hypothetical protein